MLSKRTLVLLWVISFLSTTLISAAVNHIHLGSTNNPLNGVTISWRTSAAASSIRWGYTAGYEKGTFTGTRRNDYSGYLYDYKFPVLTPSSTIHYSINDGSWSTDKTFRTSADTLSTSFSFIAGGDSRTNLTRWQAIANRLLTEDVDFHLYCSDVINSGSNTNDWNMWYSYGNDFIEKNVIFHSYGNHDVGSIYFNQFVLPGNERYYSFTFGNALVICLDSQAPSNSTQYAWLRSQLQNNNQEWTVVYFHKPFYTIGSHVGEMDAYFSTWWKAFDDYGVDLILNGHTHNFMRAKPLNRNVSTTQPVAEYGSLPGQGRLQIVTGGYGAGTTSIPSNWFVAEANSSNHYCKFTINGSVLHLDAYTPAGVLIDSLTIQKGPVGPDILPPVITVVEPSDSVVAETQVTLQVRTNEPAYIRYSLRDESYNAMSDQFTQGEGTYQHSTTVSGSHGQSYTYYVRAIDDSGNASSSSTVITFAVDTTCVKATWKQLAFDHSSWDNGPAELGYGDGGEATVISFGGNSSNKYITYYFRHIFNCPNAASVTTLNTNIKFDDGIALYLNGTEVTRQSLPGGTLTYNTYASSHEGSGFTLVNISAHRGLLRDGRNLLAAEVHQTGPSSSDISFDLDLVTQSATLVPRGATWYYYDKGAEPEEINSCQGTPIIMAGRIAPQATGYLRLAPLPGKDLVRIGFSVPQAGPARVSIFDLQGNVIHDTRVSPGTGHTVWDYSGRAQGLYIISLVIDGKTFTKPVILF